MNDKLTKCQYCGKLFHKTHGNQKYCSETCAKNSKREQTANSRMKYYYKNKKRGGDKFYGLGTGGLGPHKHEDDDKEYEKILKEFHRLRIRHN